MNLVDIIEHHIKKLLAKSPDQAIILRRNELAQVFNCAPSQINYCIQTRFTVGRGYVVESQRGGGGHIRIMRLDMEKIDELIPSLTELAESPLAQQQANDLVDWLKSQEVITGREAILMNAALDRETLDLPLPLRDMVRAKILAAMLAALLSMRG